MASIDDIKIITLEDTSRQTNDLEERVSAVEETLNTLDGQYSSLPFKTWQEAITSPNFKEEETGWAIKKNGDVIFNNGFFRGNISASSIDIGTGNDSFHVDLAGNMWLGSAVLDVNTPAYILNSGEAHFADITISGGTIGDTVITNLGDGSLLNVQGWQFTGTFSASDSDTVAWTSGTLSFPASNQTFSISGGNTGNMSTITYIYFDKASPTVLLTTTTATTAVGANKVLVAVAQNVASPKDATFQVFGGSGGVNQLITADSIAANTITANEIATNTITANNMNVSQLSAITANMGSITAGTIVLPSGGFIRSGQTAYDTGTGFYLGNDSGTPRLSIGESGGNRLTWNGTVLGITGNISGSTITGGTIQTATSGQRIVMNGTGNMLQSYDSSGNEQVRLTGNQLLFNVSGFDPVGIYYDDTWGLTLNTTTASVRDADTGNFGQMTADVFYATSDVAVEGSYYVGATQIITTGRVLQNITGFTGNFFPTSNDTYNLGGSAANWNYVYANKISRDGDVNVIDLSLSGRIVINQNFTFAIDNTEATSPPAGTVHWNSSLQRLRVYDGSGWRSITHT